MSKPKLICPDCGAKMNHHAMKIDYGVDDPAVVDPAFGGAVKEVHTCPECGWTEFRIVNWSFSFTQGFSLGSPDATLIRNRFNGFPAKQ